MNPHGAYSRGGNTVAQNRSVIKLCGSLDFRPHRDFRQAIDAVIAAPPAGILIDFDDVDHLDSAGLGMLLMSRDRANQAARDQTGELPRSR